MAHTEHGRFLLKFLLKSCRIRKSVATVGVIFCLVLSYRALYHKYFEGRWDNLNEYGRGSHQIGNRRYPRDEPGYFMKGLQPSENTTYCNFRYGLPHRLNWNEVAVAGPPQLGRKSPYRVIYDVIERSSYSKRSPEMVTYATHVTPEFLYHVVEIARFWEGPISLAAFVPDYDMEITMKLLSQLCMCYEGMSKVSLHLVYPQQDRPRFSKEDAARFKRDVYDSTARYSETKANETRKIAKSLERKKYNMNALLALELKRKERMLSVHFEDCSMPDMSEVRTFRSRHGLIYPVNVARNVARNASTTQYNLVSDVEMVPSEGLAARFAAMIKRQKISGRYGVIPKWRMAFVIPVFEVEAGEDVPRNKSMLQQLYADGKAVYFHRWVCSHCQKIPDLQTWIKEDPGNIVKPFAITKRQFPYHRWEPIYIGTKHTPWYSETLSWEGRQDKMTQMLEMCLRSYDFVIVNGAFLCHSPGIKSKSKKKSWRFKHELVNTKQYDLIVKSLAERYPANPKCRLE